MFGNASVPHRNRGDAAGVSSGRKAHERVPRSPVMGRFVAQRQGVWCGRGHLLYSSVGRASLSLYGCHQPGQSHLAL